MSRHMIQATSPAHQHLEICVGWDRPLGTFFAQVLDTTDEFEDEELLWTGTSLGQHLTLDGIIDALRPWAAIPPDVVMALLEDKAREGTR